MQPPFINNRLPVRDAWGRDKTILDYSLSSGMFTFDVSPYIWALYEDDTLVLSSANIVSTDGMLDISSNANKVTLASKRHPRYQPNRGLLYAASMILPGYDADAYRRFGIATNESGVFFELDSGVLYAVRRTLSVNYREEIKFPNGVDLSKGCLYDIQMQWRGVGDIHFTVTHQKGTTVHHMSLVGTLDALSVSNPAMHLYFEVEAKTEDATMYCGCVDLSTEGGRMPPQQYGTHIASVANVSTGNPITAIRQPMLINGMTNTRDLELARITVTADKKSDYTLYRTSDPTAITATWTVCGGGCYIEYSDGASITAHDTAKMTKLRPFHVPAADLEVSVDNPNKDRIEFYMVHGDYLFIEATNASIAAVDVTIEWGVEV